MQVGGVPPAPIMQVGGVPPAPIMQVGGVPPVEGTSLDPVENIVCSMACKCYFYDHLEYTNKVYTYN